MLAFHAEERRDAMLTYVVDLYAGDLDRASRTPYRPRTRILTVGLLRAGAPTPRPATRPSGSSTSSAGCAGGSRSMCPPSAGGSTGSRSSARKGLRLRADHTFNDEEYNTFACPWHNNLTAAICSFRTAKALRTNPASRFDIHSFRWHNSVPFEWPRSSCWILG
jgi:hypothetical protein